MNKITAALAAVLLSASLAGTAQASAAAPPEGLFLTVSGSQNTWTRGILLSCSDAPGAMHPDAQGACAALAAADNNLDALAGDPHTCSEEVDPVTVTAKGRVNGKAVSWQKTYPNACVMDAETGPLFRF